MRLLLRYFKSFHLKLFALLLLFIITYAIHKFLTRRQVPPKKVSVSSNELPLLQRDPTAYCEKATSIRFESSLQEFVERLSGGSDLKPLIQPLLSSSLKGERRTQQKKLIVWSADLPVGPAADARHVFEALGVQWVERAGEAFCPNSRSALRALDYSPWNPPSREEIAALAEQLSSDRELQSADAVFVSLPTPANVEFFARFNGSLILVLATRYEEGRYETARWTALDQLLRRLHGDTRHILVANNRYDAQYFRHFTGVELPIVPSLCGYVGASYSSPTKGFALAALGGRLDGDFARMWSAELEATKLQRGANFTLETIATLYGAAPRSEHIARHRGVVWLPFDVNPPEFTLHYRANVPLFVPSVALLARWHASYFIVRGRTLVGRGDRRPGGSFQRPHVGSTGRPDPNNEWDEEAIRYWLQYADYYTLPHVAQFDSIAQLVDLLASRSELQLREVSRRMHEFNRQVTAKVLRFWRLKFERIAISRSHRDRT